MCCIKCRKKKDIFGDIKELEVFFLCVQIVPFFRLTMHMFCFLYVSLNKATSEEETLRVFSIKVLYIQM